MPLWAQRMLHFFFPSWCEECNTLLSDGDLPFFCRSCWKTIRPITGPTCSVCGQPNPTAIHSTGTVNKNTCHCCLESLPHYDTATAIFRYEGVLANAIQCMKYQSRTSLISPLTRLMREHLDRANTIVDAVLAVPLHINRLRTREFNQSLALAKPVAETLGAPLVIDNLVRIRPTPPQTTLEWKDRHTNVRHAFSVRRPDDLDGKILLLVDDVLTTGSTVNECSRTLRKAGAKSVHVLTLSRTI